MIATKCLRRCACFTKLYRCCRPSVSRTKPVIQSNSSATRSYATSSSNPTDNEFVNSRLMMFFDNENNFGVDELVATERPGRSWEVQELRLKSERDLHELWFILLIERNMLLTMEHAYKSTFRRFPNPERIDRVEESMANMEQVVNERNKAYLELEMGHDGSRPERTVTAITGLRDTQPVDEHLMPPEVNPDRRVEYEQPYLDEEQEMFIKLWNEREWYKKQRERDDYMRTSGKARLHYDHEQQIEPHRDYFENKELNNK